MKDELLRKLDFLTLKELELPDAERTLVANIIMLAEELTVEVWYCDPLKVLMLKTQHGVESSAIATDIINLTCVKDMLRFMSDAQELSQGIGEKVEVSATPQLELGSDEWQKEMRARAKLIGNGFSEWEQNKVVYFRRRSPNNSPFVIGNAYRVSQDHKDTRWTFSNKLGLTRIEYELIQKFIEHDERIYQAWLDAGQPEATADKLTLLESKT